MRPETIDCPHCELVHQHPLPTPEVLDGMAQRLYSSIRPDFARKQREDLPWLRAIQDDLLRRLLREAPERTLIDVGSGLGHFVRRAGERGFAAVGLDPSRDAVEHARALGVETVQATIEELDRGTYGVITMFNMLEHVLSPYEVLLRCRERLVRDGLLWVSVPNDFNPLQRRLESRYGPWWVHPLHVTYFSPTSLRALVERAGYDVVWSSTSFPLEVFALAGLGYPTRPRLGRALHRLRTWLDRAGLHRAYPRLAVLGLGRHVNLLLRRSDVREPQPPRGPCPSHPDFAPRERRRPVVVGA